MHPGNLSVKERRVRAWTSAMMLSLGLSLSASAGVWAEAPTPSKGADVAESQQGETPKKTAAPLKDNLLRIRDHIVRHATGIPDVRKEDPAAKSDEKSPSEVAPVRAARETKKLKKARRKSGKKTGNKGKVEVQDEDVPTPMEAKVIEIPDKEGGVVYWLEIHDVIELGLAPYVERAIKKANEDPRTRAVISELHTPGGRVDAAVRIRDALLRAKVPTIAFINSEAISAGALIALAHDYIVVVPGGTIGAATPVQMGGGGESKAVGEKVVSYVRGVFRATAEARDRDPRVAEAMVDADVEVPGLVDKGKLLTASANEAVKWGIVDLLVADEDELFKSLGVESDEVEAIGENWAESLARVLTNPVLSGLLMSLGFLGLLMEFYTPGFGVTGTIGVGCLMLFFLGQYVVQLAGMEEIAVFLLGMVLLGAEIFITPGFGLLGLLGLFLLVGGLVFSLHEVPALPIGFSFDADAFSDSVFRVFVSLSVTLLLAVMLIRRISRTSFFRSKLVLTNAVNAKAVSVGGTSASDGGADEEELMGKLGSTRTLLRPSGKVVVGGTVYDAITQGESVDAGQAIEVVGVFGSSLVVRSAPETGEEGL